MGTINARQYTRNGLEAEAVADWCKGEQTNDGLLVATPNGKVLAGYGDWVVKNDEGEFMPCKPDIFNLMAKR